MTPEEPTYIVVQQAPPPAPKRKLPRVAILAIVAVLVAGAGAGTFASFSASTSNTASFATGTLVLSNKVNTATTCYSTGVATNTDVNDQACDALFAATAAKPGDTSTVNLTLKNEGSINGSKLQSWISSTCSSAQNPIATYTGTGNLCTALQFTVQEYSDAARTTASTCWYGAQTSNVCNFSNTALTINSFQTSYPSSSTFLDLGAFNAGVSRYFTIGVAVPSTATNNMQGRLASFGIKWNVIQ